MRCILSVLTLFFLLSSIGYAQEESRSGLRFPLVWGNKFGNWDRRASNDITFGLGYVFENGCGVDVEFGTHGDWHWDEKCDCYTAVAVNGSYYFNRMTRAQKLSKFEPFVTAGYEYFSADLLGDGYSPHLVNAGGGINYWFLPIAALRGEFREHILFSGDQRHFPEFRLGLTLLFAR